MSFQDSLTSLEERVSAVERACELNDGISTPQEVAETIRQIQLLSKKLNDAKAENPVYLNACNAYEKFTSSTSANRSLLDLTSPTVSMFPDEELRELDLKLKLIELKMPLVNTLERHAVQLQDLVSQNANLEQHDIDAADIQRKLKTCKAKQDQLRDISQELQRESDQLFHLYLTTCGNWARRLAGIEMKRESNES